MTQVGRSEPQGRGGAWTAGGLGGAVSGRRGKAPPKGAPEASEGRHNERASHQDVARKTAHEVLSGVTGRGAYANLLLATVLAERGLPRRDAALATELVYGTLRGLGSYDTVIGQC